MVPLLNGASVTRKRTVRKNRFIEEQIIAILAEHELRLPTADVCRKHGLSSRTVVAKPRCSATSKLSLKPHVHWRPPRGRARRGQLRRVLASVTHGFHRSWTVWIKVGSKLSLSLIKKALKALSAANGRYADLRIARMSGSLLPAVSMPSA